MSADAVPTERERLADECFDKHPGDCGCGVTDEEWIVAACRCIVSVAKELREERRRGVRS